MKKIKKTLYLAKDGKEFADESECKDHEDLLRLADLVEHSSCYYHNGLQGNGMEVAECVLEIMDKFKED